MEALFLALVIFIGVVVFYLYSEVQSVDKNVWQSSTQLRQRIQELEKQIVDLNRTIKNLKDSMEKEEEDEEL